MRRTYTLMFFSLAVMCIYLGWTFYSRWRDNQALIQRLEESRTEQNRAFIEAYSGGIKIMGFYATPGIIHAGGKTRICYSVVNAETLRIEPPVGEVWPSRSRCIDVRPAVSTVYTLIAEDAKGNTKTAGITVKVQ